MNLIVQDVRASIDWWVETRPLAGEAVSGDVHIVKEFDGGVLVAVIDGVGHGEAAQLAALSAVTTLETHVGEPLARLMERCHEVLASTRGAAVTLVAVREQDENLHWLSVGNVDARVIRVEPTPEFPSEGVVLRAGLVGCRLPNLLPSRVMLQFGDVLVVATDGISAGFDSSICVKQSPKQIAQNIMRQHVKGTDDALVFAARYVGGQNE